VLATRRTTTVTRHEWALPLPAHRTDVARILNDAAKAAGSAFPHAGPITVTAEDDVLVVGYETKEATR